MVKFRPLGLKIGLVLTAAVLVFSQIAVAQARSNRYHSWHRTNGDKQKSAPTLPVSPSPTPTTPTPTPVQKTFQDLFSTNYVLEETGSMSESSNLNWWLSSGGRFIVQNGVGQTIQGALSTADRWYKEYAKSNPVDTDNGAHPQNIFRLVTKSKWQNLSQEAHFLITKYNLSSSPERYDPNGLLFFNRYIDQNNLYYTGIRVDGTAVIKKKIGDNYYTISQTKVFPGSYNRSSNPNLLPVGSWIGLRSEVTNNSDGSVNLRVYVDKNNNNNWELVISTKDDGKSFGCKAITQAGFGGIRTDFMDVKMDNYQISEK